MKMTAWIISAIGVVVLTITVSVWAQAPVPISPGSDNGTALVISGCPTFSWAEVTKATGYKVTVFAHEAAESPLFYEDIAATQTPVLVHDIPVRALTWTPSADQGLCAGTYAWYVAAVQWGEVLEWSEGRVFAVDALAGLDAASGKCMGMPADIAGDDNPESQLEAVATDGAEASRALSLEQVISGEVTKDRSFKSTESDKITGSTPALGPITMGVEDSDNTFYGNNAGYEIIGGGGGTGNAFFGKDAGAWNGTGSSIANNNTFIGHEAGELNEEGDNNTHIGYQAGHQSKGSDNTFIGQNAGKSNTTGYSNTFIGQNAGQAGTTISDSVFIGKNAGMSNTTGEQNVFIGSWAGSDNTVGVYNTFIGTGAGGNNTTGSQNTFVGWAGGGSNTEGGNNTFVGQHSGWWNSTGSYNTFLGSFAGYDNITGKENTFIGMDAGSSNKTGDYNTCVGRNAGRRTISGSQNTFIGWESGANNKAIQNTFVGASAGSENTDGYFNTFLGSSAGSVNTTGNWNTFIGHSTGKSSIDGYSNTFIGHNAGLFHVSGYQNTALGLAAGQQNVSGYGNVFIGYAAGLLELGSNRLYIANSDTETPLIYGEFDNNILKIHGELQMLSAAGASDKKLKKDIQPLEGALEKVKALHGVTFSWDLEQYPNWGFKDTKQIGLIAQNVEEVMPELVSTDSKGYKAVSYDKLTAVLVEAVKELKAENEALKSQNNKIKEITIDQQSQINELRALIKGITG